MIERTLEGALAEAARLLARGGETRPTRKVVVFGGDRGREGTGGVALPWRRVDEL